MSDAQSVIESFRNYAATAIELAAARGGPSDYGVDILQWYENDLTKNRTDILKDQGLAQHIHLMIGSLLGECLCQANNGSWILKDQRWGVNMDNEAIVAFPFSKVAKFLTEEDGESFVALFKNTPALLKMIQEKRAREASNRPPQG